VRITSAVAVAAIMAAASAATQTAQQRSFALSLSQCFMAAANGLLPTPLHPHTHSHTLSRRWLSRESVGESSCSVQSICGGKETKAGWEWEGDNRLRPFQCCATSAFSSFWISLLAALVLAHFPTLS